MFNYLVTTHKEDLPTNTLVMVDGTVPDWIAGPNDRHWDHHRPGGAAIQIDEMPRNFEPYLELLNKEVTIVTTQLDADAVIAAAWVVLITNFTKYCSHISEETIRQLRAIAHDCDHLFVPHDLSDLADFAAQAVATLKANRHDLIARLRLPEDHLEWTKEQSQHYYAESYRESVEWIVDAVTGKRHWPGQLGEAKEYWQQVTEDTKLFIESGRLYVYRDCFVCDQTGIGRYVDPRSMYAAIREKYPHFDKLQPVALCKRDRKGKDGISYTLGSIPLHPLQEKLDYTQGILAALTTAEKEKNPNFDKWGGRKIVCGSSWNFPSLLSSEEVIDSVLINLQQEQ